MGRDPIQLSNLEKGEVPADLRAETYFDWQAHPFDHRALFEQTSSVYGAILGIHQYAVQWLEDAVKSVRSQARCFSNQTPGNSLTFGYFEVVLEEGVVFEPARIIGSWNEGAGHFVWLARGAKVIGADLYLDKGSIYIGEGSTVEPCVGIKGPTIVGKQTEIRQGAYLRGNVIIGNGTVIRGEIKNSVVMDNANFPHPSYLGDSICGYATHFGNQATSANLGIFAGLVESDRRRSLVVRCQGRDYDLGKPKMGICMGDFSQVGCNSVSDPGTFLKPCTIVYALSRINKGFYGPNEVLKNKPLEHGVIERVVLESS
jgi:carbonic anhydrase/acetyltransferase-like protein (isoleucine patch superfamily)